jgi:hypothetical protein
MSVETNSHNYTNMNLTFSQFKPARISPKENSGASGGFLPKPLLLRLRLPNSKKISRVFCEILSPKNSFRKTESALFPFHSLGFSAKWVLTFSNKHHTNKNKHSFRVFIFVCVEMAGIEPACKENSYRNLHVYYIRLGLNIYSRGYKGKINTELLIVGFYIKRL